ncbi:chromosomal replication initiator protein DnaA [Persicirhabdus sediminis]|uniref:Chromosomal replication initiator protein DnaA n=1 Tax=Persicirhabdus sediminis TaxID=454144 RepID=A0A8J7MCL0_9BACT|nr:chromosomal replication initiator protein DnaA [Persicirhabdus sediminis]MBK1790643.1 chromosomal replication initiator protein DnaA [Persicirhabdus sediminis]
MTEVSKTERLDLPGLWEKISVSLKELVSPDAYSRWFQSAELIDVSETQALLGVPSDMHQVWIETNYLPELQNAFTKDSGLPSKVSVVVAEDGIVKAAVKEEAVSTSSQGRVQPKGDIDKRLKTAGLNPQFAFDRFVVGHNNEFAHAACAAVAEKRGGAVYNPLFIHGGSGLGKTHLMQAIGQQLMNDNPSARVVYLTCEKFTNEFIDMVRKGSLENFRKKYRRADILLIDDIQFLAGKERSQEEFFHTFNTLLDLQSQIVLTSDRPASEIKNVEPRLISRFECGLTVEMQPPSMETRLAILQRKMEDWDVKLDDGLLYFLAERIRSNVRRLEGGLVRLATYASLGSGLMTQERAEELLKDILRQEGSQRVTIDAIQKAVCEHYDVRMADMTSRRRPANIAFARQMAMYLSRQLTQSSLMEIGDAFGGRDHGTVIHACRKIKQRIESERGVGDTVDLLSSTLSRA